MKGSDHEPPTNANCDPDDVVELSLDDSELSDGERAIVRSWLSGLAGSPLADPWSDALTDGRHRLWSAWQADPNALLPIHSDLLPYEARRAKHGAGVHHPDRDERKGRAFFDIPANSVPQPALCPRTASTRRERLVEQAPASPHLLR